MATEDVHFTTFAVPFLDTGIGQEAGYANDAELMAAAQAEREVLPPDVREVADRFDAELDRRVLFGDS